MNRYQQILHSIQNDGRYQKNIGWGRPRRGHPEGSVQAHIEQLEQNLEALQLNREGDDYWKLKVLVHVHDTFKAEAEPGVAILDPRSHASLARQFLAQYCDEEDLQQMVQLHDEPFALFRQQQQKGHFSEGRCRQLMTSIRDWKLFLQFLLVDGWTPGKTRQPLDWTQQYLSEPLGLALSMQSWRSLLEGATTNKN